MRLTNLVLLASVFLLDGLFLASPASSQETFRVTGVAESDELKLRASPNANAAIVGRIPPDARRIRLVGPCKDWCQVQYGSKTGWVSRRYLRADEQSGQSTAKPSAFSKNLRAALKELTERGVLVPGDRVESIGDGESVILRRDGAEFSIAPVIGSAFSYEMRNVYGERIAQVDTGRGPPPDELLVCIEPLVAIEEELKAKVDGTPETTKEIGNAVAFLHRKYCRLIEETVEEKSREQVTDTCYQASGTYRDETVFWRACGD